ncbi:UDP-N-acetylglucosamine 4,6-dehydratase (inverting) [Rhodospirillaceae bacterium RKSG073]|nr:UDP-N-acetylglucosamine 4,6-dehydratase (inverting) [Curvivirga aplysinae]
MLENKTILITGGTGSFGKAFATRILDLLSPKRLIIFSRDEMKQFDMQQEYPFRDNPRVRFFIGDVRDLSRLEIAFQDVDFVIHAAALKQVPTAEYNPFECVRTNILGTENVMTACLKNNVQKVIALSTDKACVPVNLYGATKLAADKLVVAANSLSGSRATRFSVVRYGNVLGSRGSVVPFFCGLRDQNKATLPITDARMTRFMISLPQAVDFVLSNLLMMRGGEIFVPKIKSFRIPDLAKAIAPNMEQEIVGIRPGEKMHEAMISLEDTRQTLDFGDRYVLEPISPYFERRSFTEDGYEFVAEDFEYSSHRNPHFLSMAELQNLLQKFGFTA